MTPRRHPAPPAGVLPSTIFSPSDLLRPTKTGEVQTAKRSQLGGDARRLCIGGRLVQTASGWQLADAFARMPLRGTLPEGCRSGDLVQLEGNWLNGAFDCISGSLSRRALATPEEFRRLADTGLGERLSLRASLIDSIRAFFRESDFLEVDTPFRTAERCLEENIQPIAAGDSLLITSPELHMKRLLVAGVPRLFQLAHCFRGGEKGLHHHPEFLMLEWYRAFSDQQTVMKDTEKLLEHLCLQVHGSAQLPVARGRPIDLTPPFDRVTVRQAFQQYGGVQDAVQLATDDEAQYFQVLVDSVEPALARLPRPVFLCEYPATQAALARLKPADRSVAERFELYVGGIELCNGYGELNDAEEQRQRMQRHLGRPRSPGSSAGQLPQRFLAALEQGMPPAGGNALGVDRLVALLAGQSSIDSVMCFAESPA